MKKRLLVILLIVLVFIFSGCVNNNGNDGIPSTENTENTESSENTNSSNNSNNSNNSSGSNGSNNNSRPGGGGMMGGTNKNNDAELQSMISDVMGLFEVKNYTDSQTNLTLPYNLYLPKNYSTDKEYPLVVFIGDMTTVGTDSDKPLKQGWGGLIWATEAEQAKHECIVVVPVYPVTILDDRNGYEMTDYVEMTPRLIKNIAENYSVDENRIYGTGQSMGAMTTLYLAATYTDLYAAVMIVDGQWDISTLKGIESQKMIYFAAGGDASALNGQNEVKAMMDNDGVGYGSVVNVDAQAWATTSNEVIAQMLEAGNALNFVNWTAGTVLGSSSSSGGTAEHMASFDYAYKISAARDWLFSQSK